MAVGAPYWNFVVDVSGNAIRGASVAVVDDGGNVGVYPGYPLAALYTEESLTNVLANPMITDSNGRFVFYTNPGNYWIQVYGTGVQIPYSYPVDLVSASSGILYVIVPFSATPVFDCLGQTATFDLTLNGNVTSSTMANLSIGTHIAFIIQQDGVGSHTFVWPANVHNAPAVEATAGGITVQNFIVRNGNQLYPLSLASYN